MMADKNWKLLVQAVENIWQTGLVLNPDALHYIDSTLSAPSIEEVGEILADESNCERDSLLELIFFPDESVQVQLEDLLENHQFHPADQQKVLNALVAKRLRIMLRFPDSRRVLMLAVPDQAAGQFIARLNISKKTDPRILEVIQRHVPVPFRRVCKVRLRNARFPITENKITFLCAFFEKMTADVKTVLNCFDFLLVFFEDLKDDSNLYAALMSQKRFYIGNLQKADSEDMRLRRSNMEILILQGVRRPYFDKNDARSKIELIDRISYSLFGKSDDFGMHYSRVDRREFYRKDGL